MADPELGAAIAMIQDSSAFPVVVSTHSFFANVRDDIARVGRFAPSYVLRYGRFSALSIEGLEDTERYSKKQTPDISRY